MTERNSFDSLGYLLKVVQHELRQQMDQALNELDLTTPQYVALSVLAEQASTNAELARRCFVKAQTMISIVQNLEKRDFISRHQDPNHGLKVVYALTEKARETLTQADRLVFAIEDRMREGLSDRELQMLLSSLQDCLSRLKPV